MWTTDKDKYYLVETSRSRPDAFRAAIVVRESGGALVIDDDDDVLLELKVRMRDAGVEVQQKLELLLGSKLKSLDPDAIGTALGPIQWKSIPTDIDEDETMPKLLELASLRPSSEVVVITDASFGNGVGAFVLTAAEFDEFQRWHLDEFAERIFSGGDVILWAPMDKRMWLVHHEGVYATVQLRA